MEPYPLSTIQEILECIDKKKGVRVDIGRIPFDDLMNLCALYGLEGMFRPATFEKLPKYIAIKTGKNKVDNIHPDVAPIISPTCGMILYQEQVTEILSKIAGYSTEDAEKVRRMLAKRNPEQISKIEPEFFCRCETQGYDKKNSIKILELDLSVFRLCRS